MKQGSNLAILSRARYFFKSSDILEFLLLKSEDIQLIHQEDEELNREILVKTAAIDLLILFSSKSSSKTQKLIDEFEVFFLVNLLLLLILAHSQNSKK